MNLLIGSRALNHWNPACKIKPTSDWDVISSVPIEGTEWHRADFLNNEKFFDYASDHVIDFNGHSMRVCNPIGLAIIKRSHLWRDLSFDKHITHYHKHMVHNFNSYDREVLTERILLTKKEFPQGNPKLNQTVEDFFDDTVKKKYNHDWLHTVVAFNDKPLYQMMQRDPEMAWCEKDMWENFTHLQKLQCVAEESYVIAVERFMVPNNWNFNPRFAYLKSLNKVCTTLCSGFFRDFSIDFYPEIFNLFDQEKFNFVKQLTEDPNQAILQV